MEHNTSNIIVCLFEVCNIYCFTIHRCSWLWLVSDYWFYLIDDGLWLNSSRSVAMRRLEYKNESALAFNVYSWVCFISLPCLCHLRLLTTVSVSSTHSCLGASSQIWLLFSCALWLRSDVRDVVMYTRCWITLTAGNIIRPSDRKCRCHCSWGCPYWRTPALHNNTDRHTGWGDAGTTAALYTSSRAYFLIELNIYNY